MGCLCLSYPREAWSAWGLDEPLAHSAASLGSSCGMLAEMGAESVLRGSAQAAPPNPCSHKTPYPYPEALGRVNPGHGACAHSHGLHDPQSTQE